ncbi:orotidine-5'-phosphate decarboxylase [Thermodesulfobacteriota bacterium]
MGDLRDRKLILALDLDDISKVKELVGALKEDIAYFKVGSQMFTRFGPVIIDAIKEKGGEIFLDLKYHDISNTCALAAKEVVRLGVGMFNVHALGGREMMQRTREEVVECATVANIDVPKILGVTVLTSLGQEDVEALGIKMRIDQLVLHLASIARDAGLDGIVASPQEIKSIRNICGPSFLIVTPGIRPRSVRLEIDDQKRVMTPDEAVRLGADYLVIGRPILRASDPVSMAHKILEEMRSGES